MTDEKREKRRSYQREWIARNKEKKREYTRRAGKIFREKNREAYNAKCYAWRAAHPERAREIFAKAKRKWDLKNPGVAALATKKWRDSNLEYARQLERKWKKNNPAKRIENYLKRRGLHADVAGQSSWEQLVARIAYYGGMCAYCKTAPYEHLDHVIPISRGGPNWPANFRPACKFCNISKGNRRLADWKRRPKGNVK